MARFVASLLLLFCVSIPSQAIILSSGDSNDAFLTANLAACLGCWFDTAASVATAPKVSSVVWNCASQPCGGGLPSDASTAATLRGSTGPTSIMSNWAGGAYDNDDNIFTVGAGGHLGYYGNELYGFHFATLLWSRLSVPSSMVGFTTGTSAETMPDGNPVASHTYDGQVYVPGSGLFSIGQCGQDTGGCSGLSFKQSISALSSTAYNAWTPIATIGNFLPTQVACYDPSSGRIYLTGGSASTPLAYLAPPYTGSWTSTGGSGFTQAGNKTCAIQPGVQILVMGGGSAIAMSLSTGNTITTTITGDSTLTNCSGPGLTWDTHASKFVGWCGGTNLYVVDPSTYVATVHAASASNTVTPQCSDVSDCTSSTGTQTNGTYNRFDYLPRYDAFSVVNTIDDHVYGFHSDL